MQATFQVLDNHMSLAATILDRFTGHHHIAESSVDQPRNIALCFYPEAFLTHQHIHIYAYAHLIFFFSNETILYTFFCTLLFFFSLNNVSQISFHISTLGSFFILVNDCRLRIFAVFLYQSPIVSAFSLLLHRALFQYVSQYVCFYTHTPFIYFYKYICKV